MTTAACSTASGVVAAAAADGGARRWALRWEVFARAFAAGLGGFIGINGFGEISRAGFDANLWWIDLRSLPAGVAEVVLAFAGALLLAFGFRPPVGGSWRSKATAGIAGGLALMALVNGWIAWRLGWSGQITLGFPVPLSLAVAGGLAVVAWRSWQGRAGPLSMRHRVAFALLLAGWPAALALGLMVCFGSTDYRRPAEVAVVFGARAYADGRPSDALADRVRTACELYRGGWVRRLVFSGGPGDGAVHETEAMRRMAVGLGVAERDIEVDTGGLNTRLTVRNTAPGLRSLPPGRVLVVSHFYHLPRVQLAYRRAGIEVRTVPAVEEAWLGQLPYNMIREVAALWVYFARA